MTLRFFSNLSLVAILGATLNASQAGATTLEHTRSFKIVYGGFANATGGNPTAKPPFITIHGTAVGRDQLFGLSIAAFDQTVIFTDPNQIADGRFVFTASDGSALTGTYHGPSSVPDARGATEGRGTFVVTGGTGRFRGVHGRGCYTVLAQLFAPGSIPIASVQTTFDGELER